MLSSSSFSTSGYTLRSFVHCELVLLQDENSSSVHSCSRGYPASQRHPWRQHFFNACFWHLHHHHHQWHQKHFFRWYPGGFSSVSQNYCAGHIPWILFHGKALLMWHISCADVNKSLFIPHREIGDPQSRMSWVRVYWNYLQGYWWGLLTLVHEVCDTARHSQAWGLEVPAPF